MLAEYRIRLTDGRFFCEVEVVPSDKSRAPYPTLTTRLPFFDMSFPRPWVDNDPIAWKHVIGALKRSVCGNKACRLSRKRCEEFFDDESNFVCPMHNVDEGFGGAT